MTFTFQNVWENRDAFIEACREKEAYESELKPLIEAKTENEFMQVVYDNFYWICSEIADFEPKFDRAFYFKDGYAKVVLNGKWGFVKEDGSYLIEPRFDYIHRFYEDCAVVELDGKFGYIKTDGTYLAPPIYDFLFNEVESVVRAYLRGIKYTINKANGQILEYSTE